MLQRLLLCAGLFLSASTAHAGTAEAACSKALDTVVGRFVGQPALRSPKSTWGGLQNGTPVVQSVCQRHPAKRDLWQVVYVIERVQAANEVYSVAVLVALIDLRKNQVIASAKDLMEPDGISDDRMGLRFGSPLGLPGLDVQLLKAPSRLAKCLEGDEGYKSTVYLKSGIRLVPVIDGLVTHDEWWGLNNCNGSNVTESTERQLGRATTSSHGQPHVVLHVTKRFFHEKTGKLRQTRHAKFQLRYNGRRYEPSSEKLRQFEDCWLNPDQVFCKKNHQHLKKQNHENRSSPR